MEILELQTLNFSNTETPGPGTLRYLQFSVHSHTCYNRPKWPQHPPAHEKSFKRQTESSAEPQQLPGQETLSFQLWGILKQPGLSPTKMNPPRADAVPKQSKAPKEEIIVVNTQQQLHLPLQQIPSSGPSFALPPWQGQGLPGFVLMSSDTATSLSNSPKPPSCPRSSAGTVLPPRLFGHLTNPARDNVEYPGTNPLPCLQIHVSQQTTSSDFLYHQNSSLWKAKWSRTNIPAASLCSEYKALFYLFICLGFFLTSPEFKHKLVHPPGFNFEFSRTEKHLQHLPKPSYYFCPR